jgi:uncharacterized peroxidase-related enzyme
MAYINVEEHLPGITGLLEFRKDTGEPIRALTQELLRGPSSLTELERELIATVVSYGNECKFCSTAHGAAVAAFSDVDTLSDQVVNDLDNAPVSDKMKALLEIAKLVRISGKAITRERINVARSAGATDLEIHDTVLIAALFCMYNRYVDGLNTALPKETSYYQSLAQRLKTFGYMRLPQGYDHLKKS